MPRSKHAAARHEPLQFWKYGYIPSGIGAHSAVPGAAFGEFSDTGGYAHLISAAAEGLLYLEDKRDWSLPDVRSQP